MKYFENIFYFVNYVVPIIAGLFILWAAFKTTKTARLLCAILFGCTCWVNYHTASTNPEVYLFYARSSMPWYSSFIEGWFKDHTTAFVEFIATGQGLIAIGLMLNKWWVRLACIGIIIFLIAIAPLGYSIFIFSVLVSIAAALILKNDDLDYLWKFKENFQNT